MRGRQNSVGSTRDKHSPQFCPLLSQLSTKFNKLILTRLPAQEWPAVIVADRFKVRLLGEFIALLTYRSAQMLANGTLDRFTLRTSVWERTTRGWQISFHQGTPTAPYEPEGPDAGTD